MINDLSLADFRPWLLICLVLAVALRDLREYRISNAWVLFTLVSGVLWNGLFYQLSGLGQSSLGILVGFGLLLPLYALGGVTAGDVKWLAALGAWYGPKGTVGLFMVSGVALGLFSLGLVVASAIYPSRSEAQVSSLDEAFESPERRKRLIPYAIPIAIGVVLIESIRIYASSR
jgi:prepilin peptidase CpaA